MSQQSPVSQQNHYKTLNVSASAAHDQIRRAYHAEARRWHPDRFNDRSPADAKRADDSMRNVNEAWRVLRDDKLRRDYDESLRDSRSDLRPGEGIRVGADNVTRIDPRLLDPAFLAARRQASDDHIDNKRSMVLRITPWVAFMALIIGIFIFTAYQGDDRLATVDTTIPGPDIGVPANACVRIIAGPQLLQIPCTGVYDGRVIGAFAEGGVCPDPKLTIREVTMSNDITVCLGA